MVKVAAVIIAALLGGAAACRREAEPQNRPAAARSLLLVTIDTLRADRVGAYGYARARTPAIDAVAARGVRFEHAYATAPITLTSHASLLTGRYPPGHGARHNGMRLDGSAPTLADTLARAGVSTAAFVSAFPLDSRFGLNKGFGVYSDRMPRSSQGRPSSERPGSTTVDEALAWLNGQLGGRFFLWVHLFEPHAPYGAPGDPRPIDQRYDEEITEADQQAGRLIDALGSDASSTIVAIVGDHGEAFGEHGEIGHSIFVYDVTLRVPLILAGPGLGPRAVQAPVSLVDLAPTLARLLGIAGLDADGVDLTPALQGEQVPGRDLYAESFAPLLDFGWSPLRSLRRDGYKFIAAPRVELYALGSDAHETRNLAEAEPQRTATLAERVERISGPELASDSPIDREAAARLQALGYASGSRAPAATRADPKDRRDLAARIAQVTSGELTGAALESALTAILRDDPQNPQAHARLGFLLLESGRCRQAVSHFTAAIHGHLPTADAHLGLAACHVQDRRLDQAMRVLQEGEAIEPGNPVVIANRGVLLSDGGRPREAVPLLQRALSLDPDLHQARFNLAVAFARAGDRQDAAREARILLDRMPPAAPQRAEIERLLAAVR